MKYLLDAKQMKMIDSYSIETAGIPSIVLMERAALAVSTGIRCQIEELQKLHASMTSKVLCVCGHGNNGADGLAVARQLAEWDIPVEVYLVGDTKKAGTKEYELQKSILINIGVVFRNNVNFSEYNFIVDGLFGIGLSRDITGVYADVIRKINQAKEANDSIRVIAIDIPSGVHATTGQIMSVVIKADETVTFGYNKTGIVLYPGASYAGNVQVAPIGFAAKAIDQIENKAYCYTDQDLLSIPQRMSDTNKGSFGKVLIIAGSENMGGAACLSALAAYRSGCGLVRVFTHENNRNVVISNVPEAIVTTYETEKDALELLPDALNWSTCIIMGPGMGTSKKSYDIVKYVIQYVTKQAKVPLIIDADALNVISANKDIENLLVTHSVCDEPNAYDSEANADTSKVNAHDSEANADKRGNNMCNTRNVILTPHMGEMSRLTGIAISEIKKDAASVAKTTASRLGAVCVLKDAITVVTDGSQVYYNCSGNCGMATAGSGDVLTGVIAGMVITGMNLMDAACMGAYVHGRAGDYAAEQLGTFSMKASDIANGISQILKF